MTTRVLLAGAGTPGHRQDHHRDMYGPAVQGLEGFEQAETLDDADLVIICADVNKPDELADLLQRSADAGKPAVVDKPTLLPTAVLADLAARFPNAVAAHHPRFHPAMTTARGRAVSGGLGLLHAVHGELLVGPGDGPHPLGELRNLAVYALDVVQSLIGDLHGRAHAVIAQAGPDGSGEAITLSLRCRPDVAVSLLIGRAGPGAGEANAVPDNSILHRYRILGSHGQLLVDLDSPAFDVIGTHRGRLPFGPSSVDSLIRSVADGGTRPGLGIAADLAAVIDALNTSAATHRAVDF
ncbi:Gfo/Idh/MocA family oxidoreductase [Nakamurella lactea]|uniref:hypothetical protein n=1 Tax=Nakamurella lactea TaxID=459515 RepID=UPI000407784E|nr:hypothetical protein [Nakamurella lactea]